MADKDAAKWRSIGQRMEERFADLSLSMVELVERSGVSDTQIRKYFAGAPVVQAAKRRGMCDGLRWSRQSLDLLEAGHEPEPLPEPDPQVDARLSRLEAHAQEVDQKIDRVLRLLEGGS